MSTPRTVQQQARALAKAEGLSYMEARRRVLAQSTSAAPALPDVVPFPEPGTEAFAEWIDNVRESKIGLGASTSMTGHDDGCLALDLTRHGFTLVTGAAGSGKSTILNTVATAALCAPEQYDLVVIDPQRIEFDWTEAAEGRRVRRVSVAGDLWEEVAAVHKEMQRRLALLDRPKVRSVDALSEVERPRLLLLIDEMRPLLVDRSDAHPSERSRAEAARVLEQIAMHGRAANVHVVAATQMAMGDLPTRLYTQIGMHLQMAERGRGPWGRGTAHVAKADRQWPIKRLFQAFNLRGGAGPGGPTSVTPMGSLDIVRSQRA